MSTKSILSWIAAIGGLNLVVVVHELGHFLACKFFAIATPVFSIGFGPQIVGVTIHSTLFRIAALPLGGYVAIDEAQLSLQPYFVKAIVVLAGIFNNFLFTFIIFSIFRLRGIARQPLIDEAMAGQQSGFVGPIGVISLIKRSTMLSINHFFLVLALLSMSIGFFNLLPIPFLDGGQLAGYTIEAVVGTLPDAVSTAIETVVMVVFLMLFLLLTFTDVRSLRRK